MPEVELHLLYEVCDDMPLLSKQMRVINTGRNSVTIDRLTVDILRFFDRRLALSVFSNYYCDVRKEDDYYFCWTRLEFPDEIGVVLTPGEEMTSFDLYEAVTSMDRQEESVILQRIYKRLAPWICDLRNELCTNACRTYEELLQVADNAQGDGYDLVSLHVGQVFTNTGDYIPRPDLFPGGYEDVRKIHQKHVRVLPYCSGTIAWRDSQVCIDHSDWQCLGPDGIRYDPYGLGNMCYHSPWGNYIREKLMYLLDEIGFDGLALDGPVHGLVCNEIHHKHRNAQCVNFMNWQWEKQFYGEVVLRGKIITAPETWNAILLEISEIPGGHREEDENELGGMKLVVMKRACAYEARYTTPPCCHSLGIPLEPYHGHSIEASEENTATYEHAVAAGFGYGFNSSAFGKAPYIGKNTRALYDKWLGLYRQYRETLLGDFIHLAQPNGCGPDAVLHTNGKAQVPGLAIVFNPTDKKMTFSVVLLMRYADLPPESEVEIEGETVKLDSLANAPIFLTLAPFEVRAIPVYRK